MLKLPILGHLTNNQHAQDNRRAEIYRSIMHWEAKVGGELFGPIPKGVRREFFCLDESTWVWHEEWRDKNGRHTVTTRYDVRPNGILKSQGDNTYQALTREEATNLYNAAMLYYQRITPELVRLQSLAK